jgi:hypothetical protein
LDRLLALPSNIRLDLFGLLVPVDEEKEASTFIPGKPFHPRVIFVCIAGSYPYLPYSQVRCKSYLQYLDQAGITYHALTLQLIFSSIT